MPGPTSWTKGARKTFETFPEGARDQILQALDIAAEGRTADTAKPHRELRHQARRWRVPENLSTTKTRFVRQGRAERGGQL